MNTHNKDRVIYYLDELSDYKVADSHKDVHGWEVKDATGRIIGKVDNLLVNKNTERVVYLDVEVDESIISANVKPYRFKGKEEVHEFMNEVGENHIIIPIGMTTLDLENKIVSTNKINYETFTQTKRLKKGMPVNRDYERDVLGSYTRPEIDTIYPEDDIFYNRDEFGNK